MELLQILLNDQSPIFSFLPLFLICAIVAVVLVFRNNKKEEEAKQKYIQDKKWNDRFLLVIVLCIIFFPIGIYGLWTSKTIVKSTKIAITFLVGIIIASSFLNNSNYQNTRDNNSTIPATSSIKYTEIGQVLETSFFNVKVNQFTTRKAVKTESSYYNLEKEDGIAYLVINLTVKNTDSESRMLGDGDIIINYNNKDYTFDKSETILEDGWGLSLSTINPLTSKTANIVYKIPSEISGKTFYRPSGSEENELIYLGEINYAWAY